MADDSALTRRDLADFLMKMFIENQAFARHHELARSSATAMFGGFATLLLGVSSFYWGQLNTAPVGAGLVVLGLGGFLLNMKLFERSAFHLRLSEAYRVALEKLFEAPARDAFSKEDIARFGYVAIALREAEGYDRAGANFKEKRPVRFERDKPAAVADDTRYLDDFNPAAPGGWVIPIHNRFSAKSRFEVARYDLYRVWERIFLAFILFGLIGISMALWQFVAPLLRGEG